jgi:PKD repeat protein
MAPCCGSFGSLTINVQEVPPPAPNVSFSYYPSNPSSFDQVQFYDQSSDPGQQQITGHRFDYGDGSNSVDTTCCPVHRFSADGDYVVTLTVTTADGRSGTGSTTVHVRTHDVAVSNFKVPQSASSGQTKPITVSIKNTRYPETVQVELAKSVPGSYSGFQTIGTLTELVLPKGGNKSTDFSFSYTFTPDDAAIGKVTLRANAQLINANDALPGDNLAISDLIRVGNSGGGRASTAGFEVYATTGDIEFGPRAVTPNPARAGAELTIRLGMPDAGEVTVEAVDLAGRIVASSPQGLLEAGIHDVRLAWRGHPAPGVYWVRATQAGRTSPAVRVAVLE